MILFCLPPSNFVVKLAMLKVETFCYFSITSRDPSSTAYSVFKKKILFKNMKNLGVAYEVCNADIPPSVRA